MNRNARFLVPCAVFLLLVGSSTPASAQLRGVRYCEVLAVFLAPGGGLVADVWNTAGFNLCPAADWEALDATALRAELGAAIVLLNGPRYWMMDRIASNAPASEVRDFGNLTMGRVATVQVPLSGTPPPFSPVSVNRDTLFFFDAGSEVYEVLDPEEQVFIMQSYSQIVDPTLGEADLPSLGERLELPAGWTYRVRVLEADLVVEDQAGVATVVQDELRNSYQLVAPALATECSDGVDNDGDGAADSEDFGCAGADDASERAAELECDDGLDNDGDGRSDYDPITTADSPAYSAGSGDPGCSHPLGHEAPPCSDGLDNDGDGPRDWDGADLGDPDPECSGPGDHSESTACGLGFELALLLPLLMAARRRGRGLA